MIDLGRGQEQGHEVEGKQHSGRDHPDQELVRDITLQTCEPVLEKDSHLDVLQ